MQNESDKQSKFTVLGSIKDIKFGLEIEITRAPWPFFDTKGGGIIIGDHVVISSGVYVHTHSHQFDKKDWRDLPEIISKEPTIIGNYVFLGVNCQIMPSCKSIGDHSVIAAGAIVTKNIPECEIWGGNPARKIGIVE